jgi:hypothetical protein
MQRKKILRVVEAMPEEIELDELLNRLCVLQQIEAGERSYKVEGGIDHEEVQRRFGLLGSCEIVP